MYGGGGKEKNVVMLFFHLCVGDSCANCALVVTPVFIVEGLLYVFQFRVFFFSFFLLSFSLSLINVLRIMWSESASICSPTQPGGG